MTRKLRVGIVGAGGSVADVHFHAYRTLPSIEVVASAELNADALARVVEKWGVAGYADLEEMLEKEALDIACICVPARYHRAVAEQIAAHKVHILVEKPLATSIEDGQAILDVCALQGVKLYYGASYRSLTANMKAREMIQRGDLGEVSMAMEVVIGGSGLASYTECGPHHYAPGTPGGCGMGIMDHGIHLIDLFSWFLGAEVETVFGRGNISGAHPASEHVTMTYSNGAVAHLIANTISFPTLLPTEGIARWGGSWDSQNVLTLAPGWSEHPVNYQIYGSKGALRIYPYAEQLMFFGKDGLVPVRLDHHPMPQNFALQMQSFVDSIRDGREPAVTGQDGLNALKIILAAYESAAQQRLIQL